MILGLSRKLILWVISRYTTVQSEWAIATQPWAIVYLFIITIGREVVFVKWQIALINSWLAKTTACWPFIIRGKTTFIRGWAAITRSWADYYRSSSLSCRIPSYFSKFVTLELSTVYISGMVYRRCTGGHHRRCIPSFNRVRWIRVFCETRSKRSVELYRGRNSDPPFRTLPPQMWSTLTYDSYRLW
jgi:hypothetical protein